LPTGKMENGGRIWKRYFTLIRKFAVTCHGMCFILVQFNYTCGNYTK
jgi:hypothetical protein